MMASIISQDPNTENNIERNVSDVYCITELTDCSFYSNVQVICKTFSLLVMLFVTWFYQLTCNHYIYYWEKKIQIIYQLTPLP